MNLHKSWWSKAINKAVTIHSSVHYPQTTFLGRIWDFSKLQFFFFAVNPQKHEIKLLSSDYIGRGGSPVCCQPLCINTLPELQTLQAHIQTHFVRRLPIGCSAEPLSSSTQRSPALFPLCFSLSVHHGAPQQMIWDVVRVWLIDFMMPKTVNKATYSSAITIQIVCIF